jgi:hypothetical protein
MRRVTYPTGLQADVQDVANRSGTIRLTVERIVKPGRFGLSMCRVGDVEVSGSYIPKGARGVCCHESLPVRTFREWDAALAFARKLRDRLAKVV